MPTAPAPHPQCHERGFTFLRGDAYYQEIDSGSSGFGVREVACPKVASGKIARVSMLALSDPNVADSNILQTISALAIEQRMKELGVAKGHKSAKSKAARQGKKATKTTTAHTRVHHPIVVTE
ncbi:hypothetical protein GFB56_29455 [Ensifer sp. T173]|uniref:Transposase n=1 Tax=Ensifer canadensis TaxID=555315 RepID=A0AAW4FTZ0_9HYPH|nr:hypothetical protein [Ensifer canadensis]MBM3094872.1 hypothetical protein [Ensifer canadensis]UBI79061.1 hypothetical protein J3R84_23430 [Ensifer canadensis]